MSAELSYFHPSEEIGADTCWALLERVAASANLRRAPRLRELLLYVGQRALKDGCDHVPEQEIGVKVFGRSDHYDNANDSIVRTTISDLRKRIDAYFATEGSCEPIIMEIPRGAYIPVFYYRESQQALVESPPPLEPQDSTQQIEHSPSTQTTFDHRFRWIATIIILALSATCIGLWVGNRAAQRSLHPWKYKPALASLWSSFLSGNQDTDIVTEDSSILLMQDISKQDITLSDYINKTYVGASDIQGHNQEADRSLLLISRKVLGKASDFRLALDIDALDPKNPRLHFYNAREYTPDLLQADNVILLGSPKSNPWFQWFESKLNFAEIPKPEGPTAVINRSPKAGESRSYYSRNKAISYCAIAYLPKPDQSGKMLLIQGTTSEATEAGGMFLLSEDQMSNFRNRLHAAKFPYFEALIKVSQVLGSPLTTQVEAYREYTNLRH